MSVWLTQLPGQIFRASQIVLDSGYQVTEEEKPRHLSTDDLVVTDLFDGHASIGSQLFAFRADTPRVRRRMIVRRQIS